MEKNTIPVQQEGSSFDICESRELTATGEAEQLYFTAKKRLLDINNWGIYSGESPDTFVLTDELGYEARRMGAEGDHIKIHLPGPRTAISDGADWVRIEKIIEQENAEERYTALTVRPCAHPHLTDKTIVHFYDDKSTNTFIVHLRGTQVSASIHGRNELINTNTDWLDILRNLLVALPAKAGLSNPHWKSLAKGLVE